MSWHFRSTCCQKDSKNITCPAKWCNPLASASWWFHDPPFGVHIVLNINYIPVVCCLKIHLVVSKNIIYPEITIRIVKLIFQKPVAELEKLNEYSQIWLNHPLNFKHLSKSWCFPCISLYLHIFSIDLPMFSHGFGSPAPFPGEPRGTPWPPPAPPVPRGAGGASTAAPPAPPGRRPRGRGGHRRRPRRKRRQRRPGLSGPGMNHEHPWFLMVFDIVTIYSPGYMSWHI